MSRFDGIRFTEETARLHEHSTKLAQSLELLIESCECKKAARSKAVALTKLEECHMWIGKMIRDTQIDD